MFSECPSYDEAAVYDQLTAVVQGIAVEEAIIKIKEFSTVFPSFAMAHNDIGVLYHRAGKPTLALAHYEKASRLQPENILFRKNLADFYAVELGWFEEAVDIYLEILKRNPRDTEALIALGQLGSAMAGSHTLEAPQIQQQIETKQQSEPIVPKPDLIPDLSVDELYRKVQNLVSNELYSEAYNILQKLVVLQPDNALFQNDLGVVVYQLGDVTGSKAAYEQAVKLDPMNKNYRKNLADLYFIATGQPDDAINIYLDLFRQNPRDIEVLTGLGQICKAVGRPEEAKTFYRRALEIEPWNNEVGEALKQCIPIDSSPRTPASAPIAAELSAKASALLQQGYPVEARLLQDQAINLNPQAAVLHNDLGVIAYSQGDLPTAQQAYEQATRLEPDNPLFAKNLADLYFTSLGRQDEAIYIYLGLHKQYPNDCEVLAALGQICTTFDKRDEAACFYRRILMLEPWNSASRDALAAL
jgi:Flp pilus assembly protein TadD